MPFRLPFLRCLCNVALSREEPNLESGANIDCCKLYRDNRAVSA